MDLNTPIKQLTRVGKITAGRLAKLGLRTVEDLIFYFPFRYEDFRNIVKINDLQSESVVTIRGKIELIANRRSFRTRKNVTEAIVADDSGQIKVIWFNQPFLTKTLKQGDEIFLAGKVSGDDFAAQMISPIYEPAFARLRQGELIHTARIVPIYPLTAGVTEKQLRFLVKQTLPAVRQMKDFLPDELVARNLVAADNFLKLSEALEQIHFPTDEILLAAAKKRLGFDELFLIQLRIQRARQELDAAFAPAIKFLQKPTKEFVAGLPFKLTDAQRQASWEILQDLEKSRPMNRLLQGDVGSGKTVTAAIAILNVILNGYKVVVMTPTEILAQQHFKTFQKLFVKNNFRIAILTRGSKFVGDEKMTPKKMTDLVNVGEFDLLIGTHALIQEKIKVPDLGFVIIDEQHRFGVKQRKALARAKQQNVVPHFLSMTATPIPRTLMLTVYGDLDLSIINQMPAGRKPIITKVVDENNRAKAYEFVRKELQNGRQSFVICPLIDPSDTLGYKSVKQESEFLAKEIFPELKIGLMHGKLKSAEKEMIMARFNNKELDILVSTSVVEVGVDIPNATIMMIEGADRFGLAQLHQFRGRVGRAQYQSYCFLFSSNNDPAAIKRLKYLETCVDGFSLAEKDLESRGSGEIYGSRQSGLPEFKMAKITDFELVALAQKEAKWVLENKKITPELLAKIERMEFVGHCE
ncbi:ATP-dependent DNA helicase RecG [Candidatus Falkowbacteria bacterium]|nr:ATP-dependent DNA helicase RecG [Candidatus Falkowbacteria bacterium]